MEKSKFKDIKDKLQQMKPITPWEEIKENGVYHIPQISTLERRELLILKKDDEGAKYKRIDDKEKKESTLHKSSIFARFLVKRKKY